MLDESLGEHGSETGSLLEETLQDNIAGETASLLERGADLDQSGGLLEQTLVEESPAKNQDHDEYDDDDFTGSSRGGKREGSEKVHVCKSVMTGKLILSFRSFQLSKYQFSILDATHFL